MNALSSLCFLGLDPNGFREVHADEMDGSPDGMFERHADGSRCECPAECRETVEDEDAGAL